jgi:hypothetical protein
MGRRAGERRGALVPEADPLLSIRPHERVRQDDARLLEIGLGAQDKCRGTSGRGALASSPDWSVVLPRVGLLTAFAILCAWLATLTFRAYQRSV